MSATPETDALYEYNHRPNLMEHARRLERERDEARESLVDTAPEQWRSQCLVARIQRDDALDLLRRIARKGEFADMDGQRLVVSDWLARRHISQENVSVEVSAPTPISDTPKPQ